MRRRLTILFITVMMVLAGCNGGLSDSLTDTPTGTDTPDTADEHDSTDGSTPSGTVVTEGDVSNETEQQPSDTPTATGEGTPQSVAENNPWGERTLTVAVDSQMGSDRSYRTLVEESLAYWEKNSERYAGYPIEYELVSADSDPDLIVQFVPTIESCGPKEDVEGCAPLYTSDVRVERPTVVKIQGEYDDDSTKHLVMHEIGHTLGLQHGDKPKDIMAAQSDYTTVPKTDAHDRSYAWDHSPLTVAVDTSAVAPHKRETVSSQIDAALGYYNGQSDSNIPSQASFKRIDSMKKADIKITVDGSTRCSTAGDCAEPYGYDTDDDSRLERYAYTKITVSDANPNAVAWYTARRIGIGALGFTSVEEFPSPLRSTAPQSTRSSRWWE